MGLHPWSADDHSRSWKQHKLSGRTERAQPQLPGQSCLRNLSLCLMDLSLCLMDLSLCLMDLSLCLIDLSLCLIDLSLCLMDLRSVAMSPDISRSILNF